MQCLKQKFFTFFPTLWYKKSPLAYFLLPIAWGYGALIWLRRKLYQSGIKKSTTLPVPVIIVGNITVGGTGKTPLVIWLANLLEKKGFKPGIISRGYGAKIKNVIPAKAGLSRCSEAKAETRLVNENSDVKLVGDEALLLAKQSNYPVVISPKRALAAKKLLAEYPECTVIISDDGLQHYALSRNIEIAVLDGKRKFGNGLLFPAGPLREPKKRLKKTDFVVINNGDKKAKKSNAVFMRLIPKKIYNLKNPALIKPVFTLRKKTVHAVAGIGNPENFFQLLSKLGCKVIPHPFSDHHWFKETDLTFPNEEIILMTEKDAVKCQQFAKSNFWVLSVAAELEKNFATCVLKKIKNAS